MSTVDTSSCAKPSDVSTFPTQICTERQKRILVRALAVPCAFRGAPGWPRNAINSLAGAPDNRFMPCSCAARRAYMLRMFVLLMTSEPCRRCPAIVLAGRSKSRHHPALVP